MGEDTELLRRRIAATVPPAGVPPSQGLRQTVRRWFPWSVLAAGLILTLLSAYYASHSLQMRTRGQFETAAVRARTTIRARFAVYNALLQGAGGFVTVEKQVTKDRFRDYIGRLGIAQHYPGVEAVGYTPRVPAPDKQNLIASMAEQGEKDFRIWPPSANADLYPVTFLEPESSRTSTSLGYDLFTDPERREAMMRAAETGDTAASGRIRLLQTFDPAQPAGFLIFFPVYQGGMVPSNVPERQAKLQGFVFAVFHAEDVFASIFADESMGTSLEIFDGTNIDEADSLFHSRTHATSDLPFRRRYWEISPLDISGRTWTTLFSAQPELEGTWIILSLLIGGLALSLAMFYLTRAEGRALRAAQLSTSQLKVSEMALRESEERLRRYATELEHRVAERTANLAQSIQSLEGVLYHVAHDLRAPLRTMSSFTHILLEEYAPKLDDKGRDYAERISSAAQRMDGLVQDLLAYGRLAHTAVPVSTVDLDAEVKAALRQFSEEIETKGAVVDISSPFPPIKANASILNQILTNLISNALKFVKPETKPRLHIHAEETISPLQSVIAKSNGMPTLDVRLPAFDGKFIRLWIEDNGIGIKPEYHERIFRMFERLHGVGTYPGTGIGLAIVQKGVERMGGRVGVESAPGAGSRFWIELPAA